MVKTKSSVFILPMILGVPIKYFSGYANVFIGTSSKRSIHTNKRIFLAFKTSLIEETYYKNKNNEIIENEDRIKKFKSINQFLSCKEVGSYTVFIFKPLEKFEEDFELFKKGKYSKFSERYKNMVSRFYSTHPKLTKILNPSKSDREKLAKELNAELPNDCEIFSTPTLIEEQFSYAKFIELY